MTKTFLLPVVILACFVVAIAILPARSSQELVVYSGRSKALVEPIITRFEQETGIKVSVRYGGTSQLAVALLEEGRRSPADLFWAQDAGALGAMHRAGLLEDLPASLTSRMPAPFRNSTRSWVATSGRARTLVYSTTRVRPEDLPLRVTDLAGPQWRGRVGWAPTNGSFQAFVTAMRLQLGDQATKTWLESLKANGAKSYANNNAIVQAVAAGEIDLGLTNHYYLLRIKKDDPRFPVDQVMMQPGDAGNLINVAGIGLLKSSSRKQQAERLISYLLSKDAQQYFADEVLEYPIIADVSSHPDLDELQKVLRRNSNVDLSGLNDLEVTLRLLREVGLL